MTEIGQRFNRSAKTVSAQKSSAMSKLGIRQDIDLARYMASTSLDVAGEVGTFGTGGQGGGEPGAQ